nr:MAG TPA: hypothetical protein [Caudoviricetes sp.]DAG20282.1 MAG TPA: hypothetical protein [Caudoviricetes sp.]
MWPESRLCGSNPQYFDSLRSIRAGNFFGKFVKKCLTYHEIRGIIQTVKGSTQ